MMHFVARCTFISNFYRKYCRWFHNGRSFKDAKIKQQRGLRMFDVPTMVKSCSQKLKGHR